MGRIIIFTGKGGVGKTSTAAAHGIKAAKEGMRTLIVSTDMAHNLSDIFETEIKKVTLLRGISFEDLTGGTVVKVDEQNFELKISR